MSFKYFFWNEKEFLELDPTGKAYGFALYSPGHLIWLAVILLAAVLISSMYLHKGGAGKKKLLTNAIAYPENERLCESGRRNMRRFFAIMIVLSEIYRDSVLYFTGFFNVEHLPFHLCGLAIFAIVIDAFWENQTLTRQMIAFAFMPGAVAALLFCNWTMYPFLNFMSIHSFVFHGWILFYLVMRYRAGEIKPTYKGMWMTILIVLVISGPMFLFNRTFGTNFMFLNEASEGSPLIPIWNLLYPDYGYVGYVGGFAALVVIVLHIVWVIYTLLGKCKRKTV